MEKARTSLAAVSRSMPRSSSAAASPSSRVRARTSSTRSSSSGPSWRTRVSPSRSPRRRMSARSSLLVVRGRPWSSALLTGAAPCSVEARRGGVPGRCPDGRGPRRRPSTGGIGAWQPGRNGSGPRCPTDSRIGVEGDAQNFGLLPPGNALTYLRRRRLRKRREPEDPRAPSDSVSRYLTGPTTPQGTRMTTSPSDAIEDAGKRHDDSSPSATPWVANRSVRSNRSRFFSSSPFRSSRCWRRCRWRGAGG